MNESETRAEYIDPMLKASGWGEVEESRVLREFRITDGKIQIGGKRSRPEIADFILVYKNRKIAVINALDAVAEEKQRILITMATGTGKTAVAAQISWKLFQTRWNLKRDGERRPRILFLADRNILADQAFGNDFSIFPSDARVRINPLDIRKKGGVPMGGSIYFTIFQTFMSGANDTPFKDTRFWCETW